ncbi:hypothetical protein [Streptomyces sp. c-19]|uniref:hypothetical protein n=1 Tax=Streptomyces sp. c-19 TaxID=2789275 RepID=UPI00397F3220
MSLTDAVPLAYKGLSTMPIWFIVAVVVLATLGVGLADTHCLVTARQGTAYGCVREAVLTGNVLRVSLHPEALTDLRLSDGKIEAVIEALAEDVLRFREVLAKVLAYGRADVRPTRATV